MTNRPASRTGYLFYLPAVVALLSAGALIWFFNSCSEKSTVKTGDRDSPFSKVILAEKLDEPMEMTFLPEGKVLFVERKGGVKIYDPGTRTVKLVATLPVNIFYTNRKGEKKPAEEGLMGVVAHPQYEKNHWIYMYYADPDDSRHVLARWELVNDKLVEGSKKILLAIPTQREECCHTGGGMVFDAQGNLYLTVGNNTVNPESGTSNLDERKGMENSDDQRTAGNTNDLRGKILRIHPNEDGTYSIPAGNLFPSGREKTRPEIYTMGHRNPWRPTIDSKTGYLYWGEVGPDASSDSIFGPKGYDEFNQAREAGNFGWPYFIADNKPYNDYDYTTKKTGPPFDPVKPVNQSPNNTGLTELPPARKALIWYPYDISDSFPLIGNSGRSATGGPVYHRSDYPQAKRPFPDYYEGKWFIVDFMRGWIMAVTLDEKGAYQSMERFLPNESFVSAIDMDFSPEGDLYVLEYGTEWFRGNDDARLVRIEYNPGKRKTTARISADKTKGAVPLTVNLRPGVAGQADDDSLTYEWQLTRPGWDTILYQANPVLRFDTPGRYKVSLTLSGRNGFLDKQELEILAGNDPPLVSFDLLKGNRSFHFPQDTLSYAVQVQDKEDGSLENGRIKAGQVAVTIDYLPVGYDLVLLAQSQRNADLFASLSIGQILMEGQDCKSCHAMDKRSIGPGYLEIAARYRGDREATDRLAEKIIKGGTGVWGDHAMSAHPQLSGTDARAIAEYILTLGEKKSGRSLPVKGRYPLGYPPGVTEKGSFVLRAAYRDRGSGPMPPITEEVTYILRYPVLDPEKAEFKEAAGFDDKPGKKFQVKGKKAWIGYSRLDLTGINEVSIGIFAPESSGCAGGVVELRIDSTDGALIGKSGIVTPGSNKEILSFNIKGAVGLHDLYFVFKNDNSKPQQPLMQVGQIAFRK
jgi:cytochrome c